MEFHWRDGWAFTRNDDGSVMIRNENFVDDRLPDSHPGRFVLLTVPPNEWASIVASVSKGGETSESYSGTLAFHTGALPYPSPGRLVPPHGSGPDHNI